MTGVNDRIPAQSQEMAVFRKSDVTTEIAPRIIPEVGSRVRLLVLLTALGLSTLAPSGASACGRLPPGVEPSGPVLRGGPNKGDAQVQPIINPHCSFTPPSVGGAGIEASAKSSDQTARPLDTPTTPN
jgi:hypothetical protein